MKIARYLDNGFPHTGIVFHDHVLLDLPTNLSVLEVLNLPKLERDKLEGAAGRFMKRSIDEVIFLPPIESRCVRDFVVFEKHIAGMKKSEGGSGEVPPAWHDQPVFIHMNPYTLIGSGQDLPMPPLTNQLDFELELAAIVGKQGRDLSPEDASKHIIGYSIFNDWSARDIQRSEATVGLGPSKSKDFASTLGPWITSADELEKFREGDRLALDMSVSINGVEFGKDNSRQMSWSFEELVSHASRASVVGGGDVIASGTAGGGALAERWSRSGTVEPRPLQVGDVIEMSIQGIGTIRNKIVEQVSPGHIVPKARRTYSKDQL
jgi:2-keto-4-pentenoate hydratase/2-oxohepta-3-ene-1,7-dioic acid hydratase in catechol pathway